MLQNVKEAETSSGLPYRRKPKQVPDFHIKGKGIRNKFQTSISKARESETEFWTPISKIKEAKNSDSHTKVFPYEGKTFARESENEFWAPISKVMEAADYA
ncbi:unnamed protein product [Rhizophagus irregularis]|nr:unnamed protein product [Rhizophagus irregularis]CAB4403247.1 unnamed protein product [Rhizophagus irregularis]